MHGTAFPVRQAHCHYVTFFESEINIQSRN